MDLISLRLDHSAHRPMYIQLRDFLAAEILSGRLQEGERLPGRRKAARQLGVSLSTVDGAYQRLADEGMIVSRPRSGFVVGPIEPLENSPAEDSPGLEGEQERSAGRLSLLSDGVDGTLFPYKTWARLFKETLNGRPDLLARGDPLGEMELRRAVSLYLRRSRGLAVGADNIVIGAGMEQLLILLSLLLRERKVAVENPGYPRVTEILSACGISSVCVPLDRWGVSPEALEASGADVLYLTPSHQFPTGLVTPAGRRSTLLRWAGRGERIIIEDDYDSEFRFDGKPMPCMGEMDSRHVVTIGTFSRTISPAIRVGYMVLPPSLMAMYREKLGFLSSPVSRFEQVTLTRYISEGHFGRSLNRARSRYRLRRDSLLCALREAFGPSCRVENTHTGLSFLFYPDTSQSEAAIVAHASALGLDIRGVGCYDSSPYVSSRDPALVVGYGSLPDDRIPQAVSLLRQAVG